MYVPLSREQIQALTRPPSTEAPEPAPDIPHVSLGGVRTVFASDEGHVIDAVYRVRSDIAGLVIAVPLRVAHFGDELSLMIRPADWHGWSPTFRLPPDRVDEFGDLYFVQRDRLSRLEEIMQGVELDAYSDALAAFISDFLEADGSLEVSRLRTAARSFASHLQVTDAAA